MKEIDAKLLKNNLKKGWTESDFAAYCNISVEEFRKYLKKNFFESYLQSIRRDLKKNEKSQARAQRNFAKRNASDSVTAVEKSQVMTEEQLIENQLNELKKQETNIRNSLQHQEKEYESLQASKKECLEKLRSQRNVLDAIYHQIKEGEEIVVQLMKELETTNQVIAENEISKAKREQELLQVVNSMKALEVTTINCYSDGRVVCEAMEDLNWSQKFQELTTDSDGSEEEIFLQMKELAENLSIKEVKQLAKLLTLLELLEKQNKRYQILFEEETQVFALLELLNFKVMIIH